MLMINEGNYIDYRYFDAYNIIPRYEFGHGLSYTTFNYTNLSIASPSTSLPTYPTGTPSVGGPPPPRPLGHRGADQRHDQQTLPPWTAPRCRSCISGSPRRRSSPCGQLRGFERVEVAKGDAVKVVFEVKRRDISFWDVKRQQWGVVGGRYEVGVGGEFEGFEVERGV